jgi:hypothetical protein
LYGNVIKLKLLVGDGLRAVPVFLPHIWAKHDFVFAELLVRIDRSYCWDGTVAVPYSVLS